RHLVLWMGVFVVVAVICGFMFKILPTSVVPDEDQGYAVVIATLPSGATMERTNAVMDQISDTVRKDDEVADVFTISGFSFVGSGENVGMAFIRVKPWDDRRS